MASLSLRHLTCLVALSLAATAGHTQSPTPEEQHNSTIQVKANLVVLDVVVTDAAGKIVPDLTKDDFLVTQDGKPQTIKNFDSWKSRAPLPDKPHLDRFGQPQWGDAPLNIFVLDQINTPFDEITYAAAMLKKYLRTQPELLPFPSMLIIVNDYGSQTLQQYTRSRDQLIAALDARPPAVPEQFGRGDNNRITTQSFVLLQQIALSAAGMAEHKNILWIGRGFPAFDSTTLTTASTLSLNRAMRNTVNLLLDAHATVYKIDPMQTTTSTTETDIAATLLVGGTNGDLMPGGEDPFAENFNFNEFAVQTGGHYFFGLNDLERYMQLSVTQGSEFYTLSYTPPPQPPVAPGTPPEQTYRNIKITMKRPGLFAVTRQGFYDRSAPEPEPTAKELGFTLGQAAIGGMLYTGVSTHIASVEPANTPGHLSITFTIEDNTLQWSPLPNGGAAADLTAVLIALDAKHNILSTAAYKLRPFFAAADTGKIGTGELTVRDDLKLAPKTTAVRVLVRDADGRIGSADLSPAQMQTALTAQPVSHGRNR